ncbi:MAG: hypothetical protein O7C55_04950, partial [Rickettsia endosymbiont of Ixodes persulcatus]|nr:hypothetical protein [Rickettsia endosymbiont of Ixodes persulcatus]
CHNLFIIIYNIYISIVCTYLLWSSYTVSKREKFKEDSARISRIKETVDIKAKPYGPARGNVTDQMIKDYIDKHESRDDKFGNFQVEN